MISKILSPSSLKAAVLLTLLTEPALADERARRDRLFLDPSTGLVVRRE